MQTNKKLAILELITGLFGWIWIIASIASLYYLAMVIFSDTPWSIFFWVFGVSIIAKWLAKGFQDSKNRVAYEAQLIAEGYTPEEAGKKWTEEYMGNDKT